MKKHINVIFSTNLTEKEICEFEAHISDTIGCKHSTHPYVNHNNFSLAKVYNMGLNEHHINKEQIFVFVHHDVVFKTKNWGKTLLRKFNNFNKDIIGVAGTTYLDETGVWWSKKDFMFGVVEHTDGMREWISNYGSNFKGLKDVVVVDGVFIAVNPDTIVHEFNEDFIGFHFYDIPFCIDNYIDGCKIAVTNEIRILHKSVGEVNDEWEKNRKIFVGKNLQYLPIIEDKL